MREQFRFVKYRVQRIWRTATLLQKALVFTLGFSLLFVVSLRKPSAEGESPPDVLYIVYHTLYTAA
jgi:hypothetical protein